MSNKKEESSDRVMQKAIRAYVEERTKQRKKFEIEIAKLDKLLKERSIDEDVHARLSKVLEMAYEQKWQEEKTRVLEERLAVEVLKTNTKIAREAVSMLESRLSELEQRLKQFPQLSEADEPRSGLNAV
jgi:ATP-dependent Clp protease ATP-binding subunit ClpA